MDKEDRKFEEWFDSYSPAVDPVRDLTRAVERIEFHSSKTADSLRDIEFAQRTSLEELNGALIHGVLSRVPNIEKLLGTIKTYLLVIACLLGYIAYKLSEG
jgi:chemotaxis regulatin CheY-phosphate phosphatase CheZ